MHKNLILRKVWQIRYGLADRNVVRKALLGLANTFPYCIGQNNVNGSRGTNRMKDWKVSSNLP